MPVVGLSLVLDRPRLTGPYHGYPWDPRARASVTRSPLRRVVNAAPAVLRRWLVGRLTYELHTVAALAGPPSVAHAEALLRGSVVLGVRLERQLDTIVVPLPHTGLGMPREPLNPITAAALGLGHALRLWRDQPPLAEGGTVVLLHPFTRVMGHGPQAPYRTLFAALRDGSRPRLRATEAAAARDRRAVAAYRAGSRPASPAPVRRLGGVRLRARPRRLRDRRRVPRRRGGAGARARPLAQPRDGARDGARALRRRGLHRRACSGRRTRGSSSAADVDAAQGEVSCGGEADACRDVPPPQAGIRAADSAPAESALRTSFSRRRGTPS